jgi:plasmid stabilization system protein ParE
MRVRWTMDAADDLERICDNIAESRPASARRVAQAIVKGVSALRTLPKRGTPRSIWFQLAPVGAAREEIDGAG